MKFRNYTDYEVYEDGRIYSYKRKKFLKPKTEKSGYQKVSLSDNEGKIKNYYIHRVVYESFSGEPIPYDMQINHIDERKDNNMISNLELMSRKENIRWGTGIERSAKARAKSMINNTKISKAVGAFKGGKLVITFPSTQEAGRNGFDSSNVAACCNGKRKTHKGFQWKFI